MLFNKKNYLKKGNLKEESKENIKNKNFKNKLNKMDNKLLKKYKPNSKKKWQISNKMIR